MRDRMRMLVSNAGPYVKWLLLLLSLIGLLLGIGAPDGVGTGGWG